MRVFGLLVNPRIPGVGGISAVKAFLAALFLVGSGGRLYAPSLILPPVDLTLCKIDLRTGKVEWAKPIPPELRPYRTEIYPGRLVSYYLSLATIQAVQLPREKSLPDTEVHFLSSDTGEAVPAFDTRRFLSRPGDPLLSQSLSTAASFLDEREEIYLSNGWMSRGVPRLSMGDVDRIYFFTTPPREDPAAGAAVWTLNLPGRLEILKAWHDTVLYLHTRYEVDVATSTLVATRAGDSRPAWRFELPASVPTMIPLNRLPMDRGPSREFSYSVGEASIFVFGNGVLFALDPATGKTRWSKDVAQDPGIVATGKPLLHGSVQVVSPGDRVILSSRSLIGPDLLVSVPAGGSGACRVLRTDLHDGSMLAAYDGFVYCFTEVPAASAKAAGAGVTKP